MLLDYCNDIIKKILVLEVEMEQDILELYNTSINSISNKLEENNFQDKIDLINLLVKRANVYSSMGKFDEVVKDTSKIIELYPSVSSEVPSESDILTMVNIHILRGNAYITLQKPWDAIKDFTKVIDMVDSLEDKESLLNKQAEIYMSRGSAYEQLDKHPKAIENYTKAIEIYEKLNVNNKPYEKNSYILVLTSRGVAYARKKDFRKSLEDLTLSINLQEEMIKNNELVLKATTYLAYRSRSSVNQVLGFHGDSKLDAEKAKEYQLVKIEE